MLLSGQESAGIVRFLMGIEHADARVTEAIESAVAWFKGAQLNGIRWVEKPGATVDHIVVADREAPPLWARFYQIESNLPIFTGRDRVVRYDCRRNRERATQWLSLVHRRAGEAT